MTLGHKVYVVFVPGRFKVAMNDSLQFIPGRRLLAT